MGKDREKENHWREVIARWRVSGLSMAAFCRQEGVPDKKFFWWKRQIAGRDGKGIPENKAKFVPVRVQRDTAKPKSDGNGVIELVSPGGLVIRVSDGFDKDTLSSLLELVVR